jgi:cystathionine beta-lyase/cystathionine gamma-synthase
VFYVETIANPLLSGRIARRGVFRQAHKLVSVVDNTFASPINFRPAEWGFDLSLHSCTKYLNGHSDIVAGAVIGRAELVSAVKRKLDHLGATLDAHACFLLHRGMKTLSLRVKQQNHSALIIAKRLAQHPAIERVYYPGLESHPSHHRAQALLGGFGGMISFEMKGGLPAAERLLREVHIPLSAPSLGGVETLMTRPAATSHLGVSARDRQRAGITDSLIRMSVGIESTDDLLADLEEALGAAA